MTFDVATGDFVADTSGSSHTIIVPGVYHFAIKGELDGKIVVEEYSVGVYSVSETELEDSPEYYYDADTDDYEAVITYSVAPAK
jgi:hypothetical protein